mgnify:CR=1 FL=1
MAVNENILIDAAVQVGLVDAAVLTDFKTLARQQHLPVLELLCREGKYPIAALYRALAESRSIDFYERSDIQVRPEILQHFNASILLRRTFIPVQLNSESTEDAPVVVLSADPDDTVAIESVQRALNKPVRLAMANPLTIESLLRKHFKLYEAGPSAIVIFDSIMKEAYLRQATDLHFESMEDGMQLRMRVDGQMQFFEQPIDKELAEALLSRIKVLSGMDIAEQHMTQDGGFSYQIQGWPNMAEVEMRVATIPTRFGERATMRILGQGTADLTLAQLGIPAHLLTPLQAAVRKPHGIILVTGPTGSGKSTTLYSVLRELNVNDLNIMTVEDPIEQVVEGASQVQVTEKVSFSKALRSFLRHDPDVMLVGEIRDQETAETAVRAAMTGHLVLSTLHTNSAVAAMSRLVDIGCPSYLIASTLVGVVAQRLLRRICQHCKTTYQANEKDKTLMNMADELELSQGKGCSHCAGTGFSGRVGIYETLWMNAELEQMIHQAASDEDIMHKAIEDGLLNTLWQDAKSKVLEGVTTLKEARLLYSDY